MQLTFDLQEVRVVAGGTARFPYRLWNNSGRRLTYRFFLEPQDAFRPTSWRAYGPTSLDAGQVVQAFLEVVIPKTGEGRPAGRHYLRLAVIPDDTSPRASADCIIVVREPCVLLPSAPAFRLNPDGTITVTLSILNCGDSDLDVSVVVRHSNGWQFRCSQPTLHMGTRVGPLNFDITLKPPPDKSARSGDTVTVELSYEGHTLVSQTYSLPPAAGNSRKPKVSSGRLGFSTVAGVIIVLTMASSIIKEYVDKHSGSTWQLPGLTLVYTTSGGTERTLGAQRWTIALGSGCVVKCTVYDGGESGVESKFALFANSDGSYTNRIQYITDCINRYTGALIEADGYEAHDTYTVRPVNGATLQPGIPLDVDLREDLYPRGQFRCSSVHSTAQATATPE